MSPFEGLGRERRSGLAMRGKSFIIVLVLQLLQGWPASAIKMTVLAPGSPQAALEVKFMEGKEESIIADVRSLVSRYVCMFVCMYVCTYVM